MERGNGRGYEVRLGGGEGGGGAVWMGRSGLMDTVTVMMVIVIRRNEGKEVCESICDDCDGI